jgi:hypothetical protein
MKGNIVAVVVAIFALATSPAPSQAYDGAILVVSAADGPMPAPVLKPWIKRALEEAGILHTEAELAGLAELAASASRRSRLATQTLCLPAGSPCVMLVRE